MQFSTKGTNISDDYAKHRIGLMSRLKLVMKLCFALCALYDVIGIIALVVLGVMGMGAVEVLCLITLLAFSACLSLLSLNRNSLVLVFFVIINVVIDINWFIIFFADYGWNGAGTVLLLAVLGFVNLFLSGLMAFCGIGYEFMKNSVSIDFERYAIVKAKNELVKIDTENINKETAPVSPANLNEYIEEPVLTETERMADNLESAFKTAKLS